eukprot:2603208-Pyramimonas_sp.AAC.1
MTRRIWPQARGPLVAEWSAAAAPEWDAAIEGNAALREAFVKVLDEELAVHLKSASGHGLADVEGFPETISRGNLIERTLRLGCPLRVLYLEFLQGTAPRTLRQGGIFFGCMQPRTFDCAGAQISGSVCASPRIFCVGSHDVCAPKFPTSHVDRWPRSKCKGLEKNDATRINRSAHRNMSRIGKEKPTIASNSA